MNSYFKSKTILGVLLLLLIGLAIGFLIYRTNRPALTVNGEVDPSDLEITQVTKLTLSDGVTLSDVGFSPHVIQDVTTPDKIRIVFVSSFHCENCTVEPNLIIYNVNAMKKVSTDLPGTFTASSEDADTDTKEPMDPYLTVRIFYGLCGRAQFGIWSFSHSVDDGFYKRVNFIVSPSDISFTVDKLTAESMSDEIKNFKQLQQCESLPEKSFVTM